MEDSYSNTMSCTNQSHDHDVMHTLYREVKTYNHDIVPCQYKSIDSLSNVHQHSSNQPDIALKTKYYPITD